MAKLTDEETQILAMANDPEKLLQRAAEIRERMEAPKKPTGSGKELTEMMIYKGGDRRTGVAWYDKLTQEQQMKLIAEANLVAYGTLTPPKLVQLGPLFRECPSCHKVKSVLGDFGTRMYRNVARVQSQCAACRRIYQALHKEQLSTKTSTPGVRRGAVRGRRSSGVPSGGDRSQ